MSDIVNINAQPLRDEVTHYITAVALHIDALVNNRHVDVQKVGTVARAAHSVELLGELSAFQREPVEPAAIHHGHRVTLMFRLGFQNGIACRRFVQKVVDSLAGSEGFTTISVK